MSARGKPIAAHGALSATITRSKGLDVEIGYLQHGRGTVGPFRTEAIRVKHEYADRWLAHFDGRWRRVHIQVNRMFIVYRGGRITVKIEGV